MQERWNIVYIKDESLKKATQILERFNNTSRLYKRDWPFVTSIDDRLEIDFTALSDYYEYIFLEKNYKNYCDGKYHKFIDENYD